MLDSGLGARVVGAVDVVVGAVVVVGRNRVTLIVGRAEVVVVDGVVVCTSESADGVLVT